jgi:hypothetical protein
MLALLASSIELANQLSAFFKMDGSMLLMGLKN